MSNIKNFLFIGSSIMLQSTKFLPNIINKINCEEEIQISVLVIPAANAKSLYKYFNTKLTSDVLFSGARVSAALKTYNSSTDTTYKTIKGPGITIKDYILCTNWDCIVINLFHTLHSVQYDYTLAECMTKNIIDLIKKNYTGDIYIISVPIKSFLINGTKNCEKFIKKNNIQNKIQLFNLSTNNTKKLVKKFNIKYIPIMEFFDFLQKSPISNKYDLLKDGRHFDPYIGCYFAAACIYYSIFYPFTHLKLSDIVLNVKIEDKNAFYKYNNTKTDCPSVLITKRNKQIADNILETLFNIHNKFLYSPVFTTY